MINVKCLFQIIEIRIMMFWSQRYVVLVAAVSAVILSDFIAARSSYDGKRQKIPNLFLNHYLKIKVDCWFVLIWNLISILKGKRWATKNTIMNKMVTTTRIPDRMWVYHLLDHHHFWGRLSTVCKVRNVKWEYICLHI